MLKFIPLILLLTQFSLAQTKNSESLGPAKIAPPDMIATDSANASQISTDNTQSSSSLGADAPADLMPQIKKKKETVMPKFINESQFIEHPGAARGLIKIDKDKNYIYKVPESEQKMAGSFRIGMYEPTDLGNPDNSDLTFDQLYDETSFPMLLYDHEWQLFQVFGKLALKAGGAFYLAQGHGQFEDTSFDRDTPREQFTLIVFPLNIGLAYRFKYFKNQWIVPYAEGGFDAFAFAEVRDDDQNPSLGAAFGLAPATHFSLGGALPLGRNARSFLDLDREYGINAMYLTVEFRQYIALSDKYDFTGEVINAGITAEY